LDISVPRRGLRKLFFTPAIYSRGDGEFLLLTMVVAFSALSSTILALVPSFAFCSFASRGSFALVTPEMAPIKSTAHFVGTAAASGGKGRDGEGCPERTESARLSDMGSHSGTDSDTDEGSHIQGYYFGPSTMTVSHVRGMIAGGYFTE
jgi:hypothetical protein